MCIRDRVYILLVKIRSHRHLYLLIVKYADEATDTVLRELEPIKKVLKNKTATKEMCIRDRVLGLSAQTKVEKFVYLSSAEVYGEGETVFEETDRVNPVTIKGMLTAQGEYMVVQLSLIHI